MIAIKRYIYTCAAIGFTLILLFSGCQNGSNTEADEPPAQIEFKPPVVEPLVFSKPQQINWAAVKTTVAVPLIEKFDLNKLPIRPYDSARFKTFPKNDSLTNFSYYPNRERDFDINNLPSIPLVFKNFILPPPKHMRVGPMRFKGIGDMPIFELGDPLQGAPVTCLINDHEGFLWIASARGVFRYDGEDLCQYIAGPLDYNVFNMVEDKLGCVWISSFNQTLQIIDPRAGILKKLTKAQGLSSNFPLKCLLINKKEYGLPAANQAVWILWINKQVL